MVLGRVLNAASEETLGRAYKARPKVMVLGRAFKRGLMFPLKPRLKRGLRLVWGRVFIAAIGRVLGRGSKSAALDSTGL